MSESLPTTPDPLAPKPRLVWTPEMKKALIYGMLEQVRAGKRAESGFKKEAYQMIIPEINALSSQAVQVDVQKAKNKMSLIKEDYKLWKYLWSQSGWSLHPVTRLIMTTDENWEHMIRTRKEAAYFRTHTLEYEHELVELFGDTGSTGVIALRPSELRDHGNNQSQSTIDPELLRLTGYTGDDESDPGVSGSITTPSATTETVEDTNTQGNGRSQKMTPMVRAFVTAANAMAKGFGQSDSKSQRATEILLKEYKEQDEDWLIEAAEVLADEKNAVTFLNLGGNSTLREKWLSRKMTSVLNA